ncbi:MAG TPA: metalloregulator ArsR/SmtB family transcription factor [Polyangiaceae bacterium]|nr:metalloregulator ArsR/SmtB family transcription factor [Polyangiaceae bacterium]
MDGNLDRTLAALADPTRRRVVDLLRKRSCRPSEIAARLAMTRPAMSRHLRVLRRAGLVHEQIQQEDARSRVYSLREQPFSELREWLTEVEAFWTDQLGAFKRHAERATRKRKR